MNVRRFAAIDMWGTRGTLHQRRTALAEFAVGMVVAVSFGAWALVSSRSVDGRLFGLWLVGAGLNYAPLAVYAVMLIRPGVLDRELAGVDIDCEVDRYGVRQLWLVVPLSMLIFAIRDEVVRQRRSAR